MPTRYKRASLGFTKPPTAPAILKKLKSLSNPKSLASMARFGIPTDHALGIPSPVLKRIAKEVGRDQAIASALWKSGIHEARCLAALVGDPTTITEAEMERWARQITAWDECDACCWYLFDLTPIAYRKAMEWSRRKEEFVKRAGFALMASLALHDKAAGDEKFWKFLPAIKRQANDERNFVRKAVNWALRQIGKRNLRLNRAAIRAAREIRAQGSRSARWIAADALRELTGTAVQKRLRAAGATSVSR
jgi:3-methyladenine DNA glycosylase AlkD